MPTGWLRENKLNRRIYDTWRGMFRRCYSEKWHKKHPTYIGCYVCERWFKLSLFVEDLPKINGYDLWVNNSNERISLDKDIKSDNKNKCYCLEECIFITNKQNAIQATKHRDNTYLQGENNPFYGKHHTEETLIKLRKPKTKEHKQKLSNSHHNVSGKDHPRSIPVVGINKDSKEIIKFDYISEAKKYGFVNTQAISLCCRGLKTDYKGYVWMYYADYLKGIDNNE